MRASSYVNNFLILLLAICFCWSSNFASAGTVKIEDNQLWIDGKAQPQLFGAELQYFRLRGGQGKNIPRAQVVALWNQALDRMVEAKMNAISFYIPWDFHEYAEGKFDFTGTADEDHDGQADYPSRDLLTFFRLIEEHGIRHIMARPGPYINAEWGFLGFGAIPLWFHEKYPESHMQSAQGLKTKLYDYHNPDLLRHTKIWFKAVFDQVLSKYIGSGKPISFMQIDNETNFMWQSLYNHDYGPSAVARYQQWLKAQYGDLVQLNAAHKTNWKDWNEVRPPTQAGINLAEDQDWYRFQDESIRSYLEIIRRDWEELGVSEPTVLFTLAESYNATANGLLPNYQYRNEAGKTGMMTVNLYPKTYESAESALLNLPFKSDHDVKAADRAKEAYLGHASEWAMGPEIQGGWWKGINVTAEARRQTYLTVLGHGLKAFFVYYFNEGQNWQSDWAPTQVKPYFKQLRSKPAYASLADENLPEKFWSELQTTVDHKILVGLDVRALMKQNNDEAAELYFDAPLDGKAQPRGHFWDLKEIGEKVIGPYKDFLGRAVAVTDPVCFVKDVAQHVPSKVEGIDSVPFNSDWSAGLLGYLLQAGVNPKIVHWGLNPATDLDSCRLIFLQDNGIKISSLFSYLREAVQRGVTLVSLLDDQMAHELGLQIAHSKLEIWDPVMVNFMAQVFSVNRTPLFSYDLSQQSNCEGLLRNGSTTIIGYRCEVNGHKNGFWQIGANFYEAFNSNRYAFLTDVPQRRSWLDYLLAELNIHPQIRLKDGGDRVVVFGRKDPKGSSQWITVKNSQLQAVDFQVQVQSLRAEGVFRVTNLFTSEQQVLTGKAIATNGFLGKLKANESTVYFVEEQQKRGKKLRH